VAELWKGTKEYLTRIYPAHKKKSLGERFSLLTPQQALVTCCDSVAEILRSTGGPVLLIAFLACGRAGLGGMGIAVPRE
jgi:hypothetical protein